MKSVTEWAVELCQLCSNSITKWERLEEDKVVYKQ